MAEKDIANLGIFINEDGIFIANTLKNGKPSKHKKKISEGEMNSILVWYMNKKCDEVKAFEFNINYLGKPIYHIENYAWKTMNGQFATEM